MTRRLNARARSSGASATMAASAARTAHPDPIHLGIGEPAEPLPPFLVEAGCAALRDGHTRYGPAAGLPALRDALASEQARRDGLPRGAEQVVVTAGAKPALLDTLRVLLEPGDEVLVPAPCWPTFLDQVRWAAGRPVVVPPSPDGMPSADAVAAAVGPATRLLILNSPNNPTSRVLDRPRLRALAEVALRHDLWVLCDQTYVDLAFDGEAPTLLAAAPELRERVVVVESFSKRYSMTGLRLGAAIGPPDVMAALERLGTASNTHACSVSQHVGLAALRAGEDWLAEQRRRYRRRRDRVCAALATVPGLLTPPGEAAFFLFPDVTALLLARGLPDDRSLARRLLAEEGLRLLPGTDFGAPGHLRLSYGLDDARLDQAMERLMRGLSSA